MSNVTREEFDRLRKEFDEFKDAVIEYFTGWTRTPEETEEDVFISNIVQNVRSNLFNLKHSSGPIELLFKDGEYVWSIDLDREKE